ncbi:MAG TPA: ABC transporter ATP-binding protein [Candidatus Tenderia electrophaga]|uniref:ABC transporter ATP-binding protein n=1 Tax=Candidatus Tenderia electrophaga TaxID=1748243 RepID=A0A832N3B1_9GAMM|nr:ABC transporter ATP-binding protein [Candidatus Tenderia electrophaga]
MIELQQLGKTYGQGAAAVQALREVNLSVKAGEFIAMMGPSGSGKSTCMNILGFLDTPSEGGYLFQGSRVETLSRSQRALLRRHFIGFIFQGFNLLARTSALENVELPLVYRRIPRAERRTKALAALAAVGLEGRERHTAAELSGGQQQRVAIARALVTEPALLLADEPTGNLDSARGHEIMALLARLNQERGLSIIMVTHEAEIAAYGHRVVQFLDGRIQNEVGN